MAKFCSKCGKPLVDGVPCDCENVKKVDTKENNSDIKSEIINMFKNMLLKPFDTIKQTISAKNEKLALVLILINSLVFGLICYFTSDTIIGNISSLFNEYITSPVNLLAGSSYSLNIELPFIKIVLIMSIACFLANIIIILAEYLCIGVLFKNKNNIKEFLVIHAAMSAISTIMAVIVSICMFVSIKVAICVAVFSIIIYIVLLSQICSEILKINENKLYFEVSLAIAASLILSVITMFSMAKELIMSILGV